MDFGGSIFFTCEPLRSDLNISGYVHLKCFFFELVSLTKAFLKPRAKNSIIFSQGYLLSEPSMVYEGSRVKTFGPPFFFTGIPLRGLISKIPSTYVFFERAPLAETISDPKGEKLSFFFFDFGLSCLSTTSMVYEGSRVKTFGPPFSLQVYPCGV